MSIWETIEQWDIDLFIALNSAHSPFFDVVMEGVSYKFTWIPLYALFLFFIYRKHGLKLLLWTLPIIALLILATDQSTNLFKNVLVARYRPCHNLDLIDIVHVVTKCGGKHGFVSGHSSNSFAVATFVFFLLGKGKKWAWLFLWAALVAYSRIYNGVHYPLDVLGGAMLGMTYGFIFAKVFALIKKKINPSAAG